jgi:hypothetical protein
VSAPPQQVADLQVGDRWRAALLAIVVTDLLEQAGGGKVVDIVAGKLGPGAGLAVTGDRAIHHARIDRLHRRVTDAQLVHHAGTEALENYVGVFC